MTTSIGTWARGGRLPHANLRGSGGTPVPLRPAGREATFLFRAHGPDCGACRAYVERLVEAQARELQYWYARVMIIDGDVATVRDAAGAGVSVVEDPEGATAGTGAAGVVALVVADRFGRIFDVVRAREADALPDMPELEEWARFLATQCPECGVPDAPDGARWGV
ncbi:MAG: hypothetical protein ACRELV_00385 [Longimicrobiales bacterium]